jgi:hypothetical protein
VYPDGVTYLLFFAPPEEGESGNLAVDVAVPKIKEELELLDRTLDDDVDTPNDKLLGFALPKPFRTCWFKVA